MARAAVSASLKLFTTSHPSTISTNLLSCSFSTFSNAKKREKLKLKERDKNHHKKKKNITKTAAITAASKSKPSSKALEMVKRRTRSEKEFDEDYVIKYGDKESHIPVLLGEVLDVFNPSSFRLRSFVDCTLGAAGHSSAIIQAHPEMQTFIGLDVDPVAHEKAQSRIHEVLHNSSSSSNNLKVHMIMKNFKEVKQAIGQTEEQLLTTGVDGILMDLGMSSMQEELDELDSIGGPSTVCNELISGVESAPDPLLPMTRGPVDISWERWFGGGSSSRSHRRWI